MIVNFSIKNYGSIKDTICLSFEATDSKELEEYYVIPVELSNGKSFSLLKLGLIYGANASGKTTILKALNFLRRIILKPLDNKDSTFNFEPFLLDNISSTQATSFTLEFIQNKVKYLYEIQLTKHAVTNEKLYIYNPSKSLVYERITNTEKQLTSISLGNKISLKKEFLNSLEANTLWNNTVLGGFQKTNIDFKELHEVTVWFKDTLLPIVTPKTNLFSYVSSRIETKEINKNNVISLLKKADFNISDILIEETTRELNQNVLKQLWLLVEMKNNEEDTLDDIKKTNHIKEKRILLQHNIGNDSYSLKYEQESAGTQRYYQFCGLLDLLIRKNKILPVDEVECSLHPDLLKYFFLTFLTNSKQSQLILTTHFRELLLEKDILRNDVIWFTERKENGSTDLYSLDDFNTSVIRNTSSIYNAYKIGKLGATPNLGDYYIELDE
ncbi:AAA family ATPase [Parabacteroides bouchesdurhonensis]|uniref:AAA family ATPase n=1 Tax=Parabacteroides bouchesdurhonensis TaxID=1936995 RepID=UPI000E4F1A15|nr:ATP-binding protein [Parabacteroides bouchesdurhonensis]RHJ90616.1 ATP-binding protein [Bacteroides sp. AM07-16]